MDHTKAVLEISIQFLDRLGFADSVTVAVNFDSANDVYQISLETPDPGLLIGYHGETLSSLQLFLGQHLHQALGDWVNLSLNVNDYRQRRESSVFSLADSVAVRVIATGQPHSLPPMPASERRLVHLRLAEHPQVTTSSEGLGRHRSVIISPKS